MGTPSPPSRSSTSSSDGFALLPRAEHHPGHAVEQAADLARGTRQGVVERGGEHLAGAQFGDHRLNVGKRALHPLQLGVAMP